MDSSLPKSSRLVFVHIPKCAGTAMTNALRKSLMPQSEYIGLSIATFGHFTAFETCSEPCRNTIVWDASDLPPSADFVYGHLQYQFTSKIYPDHQFLLLMREPRARLVSHWLYWRSLSDDALALWGEWGEWLKSARQDFPTFLADRRAFCQTDNVTARLLLQPHPLIWDGQLIAIHHFGHLKSELARVLDAIDFVGFIEDRGLLGKIGNLIDADVSYERDNVTTFRASDADLDVQQQIGLVDPSIIDRMTHLDRFVWQYALVKSGFTGDIGEFADTCFGRSIGGYKAST